MWIEFDNDKIDDMPIGNYPPEGYEVMVTDGESEIVMWYVMSGDYKWFCDNIEDPDYPLSDDELPFNPSRWMHLADYEIFIRDRKINEILK